MKRVRIDRLRSHLKRGGVVAYPTESSYGLGALPQHAGALKRILQIKKRPQHKGLIVIGNNFAQLQKYLFRLPENDIAAITQHWQNHDMPTTFVLPCHHRVLPALRGRGRGQLAVRVPQHEGARRLCAHLGTALVSTSCNRAKKRPCRQEREVRRQFGRTVWVVGGRTGGRKSPSQMIDWFSKTRMR